MSHPVAFGKYYLLERINVGGMAEVFKAKAFGVEGFERLLAVKRILPNIAEDEEFITMFIDEAKIAVQLQHANIAQIFDLGKVDDSYFIALEFVHGRDLRAIFDHLRKGSERMPMSQACFVVMQICEGLDYAHNKRDAHGRDLNLVHRDVSPQNVLVGYDGEVKIVDFGIAKAAGKASKTQAGILKGKFGYMSPEQVRGLPVDRRSDIFALGIVLYELLTSERLFIGESDFSTLEKVRNVEILPPSSFNKKIPQELERIVLKALAKDVDDRYQNAIDLHDDLQAFLYSVGEFYSRKDLAAWTKKTFASELAEENVKNAQFEKFEEPTPPPAMPRGNTNVKKQATGQGSPRPSGSGRSSEPKAAPKAAGKPGGLSWDDEELETQIFDRAPDDGDAARADAESELSSNDILLTDQDGDDKTAIAPAPDIFDTPVATPSGLAAAGYNPSGPRLTGGGPPQGLSSYRQSSAFPAVAHTPQPRSFTPAGVRASGDGVSQGLPPGAPFRQTLMGMGAQGRGLPGSSSQSAPYPGQAYGGQPGGPSPLSAYNTSGGMSTVPERQPLAFAQRSTGGGKGVWIALALVLVVGGAAGGYVYMTRQGKLQIVVTPADATIALDDQPLKGATPMTIQRRPGKYNLSVSREGYVRKDQPIEIAPGQFEREDIQLEASPDTGFELTSDPPGLPVWLDSQPFTGKDPQSPQAKTDFKASNVTPGRHVLEIRGENRFDDWRNEFYQEPGKTAKIHAVMKLKGAPGAVVPPPRTPPPSEKPKAAPVAVPKPAPAVATAPKPAPKPAPAPAPRRVVTAARKPARPAPAPRVVAAPVPKPEPVQAAADCSVKIGAKPWAKVSIDGKDVGTTPIIDYKVSCGTHRVTLENSDLSVKKNETITVKSGEAFRKVYQLIDLDE